MAYQKGKSGNPGGVPKGYREMRAAARAHTPAALKALVEALSDPKLKVAAAQALLDRGWGKPAQAMTGAGGEGRVEMVITWQQQQPAESKP
jgi:hypothetical protein